MSDQNWLSEFQRWLQEGDRSEHTLASYGRALGVFAQWFEAEYSRPFEPRQLTAMDVRAYRHELRQVRGLAASTVNVSLAALRALAKYAIDSGALVEDPAVQVNFMDLAPPPPRWMKKAELRRLLAELERASNDAEARNAPERARQARRDQAAVSLMAGAGLRVNELVKLDLDDVELKPRSGRVLVKHGKGRRERQVPLGAEPRRYLREWLALRGGRAGPLLLSQKGGRMSSRAVQRMFAEMARRAGLEGYSPHSLRHTFVKNLIDGEATLTEAQALAGHRRVQSTARYAAPGQEDLERAVEGVLL